MLSLRNLSCRYGAVQALTEKQHSENGHEHHGQLVDRRDAGGVTKLQRPEVANPGCARGKTGKYKK